MRYTHLRNRNIGETRRVWSRTAAKEVEVAATACFINEVTTEDIVLESPSCPTCAMLSEA